jgi:hypothetical protein
MGGLRARREEASATRALRLLASDPLPSPPAASDLLDAHVSRRPGEMHEPLPLGGSATAKVASQAAGWGVNLDVAATLLLEAGLAIGDLRSGAGIPVEVNGPPQMALTAAHAAYVRSLTVGRQSRRRAAGRSTSVAVPVRLIPRLANQSVDQLLDAVDLGVAISWEVAAVGEGRTMAEWVLLRALNEGV